MAGSAASGLAAPATPEADKLFSAKVKAMGLSTDIKPTQWVQSAMGYNRNTTAFNYTENATSLPSMQLDYSRFMDSMMTATQPTMKYPTYAVNSPSSVQPSGQGAAGRKYSLSEDIKYTAEGVYDDYEGIQASRDLRAWKGSNRTEFPKTARRADRMVSSFNRAQNDLDAFMAPVTHYLAPMLQLTSDGLGALQDYVIDPLAPLLLSNPVGTEVDAVLMGLKGAVGYAALSLRGSSLLEGGAASGVSLDASAGAERLVPVSKTSIFSGQGDSSGVIKTPVNFTLAPRVEAQLSDSRLGSLAGKLSSETLNDLAKNPEAQILYDKSSGHINIIQEVEGRLLRITVPRDDFRIISVGPIRERSVLSSIASGRFVPIGNGLDLTADIVADSSESVGVSP